MEMGTNMLSAVKNTKDAASAGYHCYPRCAVSQVSHVAKEEHTSAITDSISICFCVINEGCCNMY